MKFIAGIASFAPAKAEVAKNLDHIASIALEASRRGADLVAFPEAICTGYFLEGGVLEASQSVDELAAGLASRLNRLERPIDLVAGFYERHDGILYNSAAYIEFNPQPMVKATYRKFFLPTYGVFDEERFVSRGRDIFAFETRLGRFSILICEDVWHSILPSLAAVAGAQVLIVPAASPARGFSGETIENHARYSRLLQAVSEEHGLFCLNPQLCGFEGGKGFIGGSMAYGPQGKLLSQAPTAEEHLILASVDLDEAAIVRAQSPLVSDLQAAWGDIQRITAKLDVNI